MIREYYVLLSSDTESSANRTFSGPKVGCRGLVASFGIVQLADKSLRPSYDALQPEHSIANLTVPVAMPSMCKSY